MYGFEARGTEVWGLDAAELIGAILSGVALALMGWCQVIPVPVWLVP